MDVLAHYLEIEWESESTPRKVVLSTHPIEIEKALDGSMRAEVSIFRDFAPWLGIHLSGPLAHVEPVTLGAQGERTPWLKIADDQGRDWWIPATGWSRKAGRHLAEMHRSFGTFDIEIGPRGRLVVDAVALELDRAHAQDYLDDFRDDLVWLAVGQPTGAAAQAGADYSHVLVEALADFAQTARRVLERPAREVREATALVPTAKLRPSADTFRAAMRRPGARAYPGRVAIESANVPENRYVRGMVEHCRRLAHSIARASDRYQGHLAARAEREKARAERLIDMDVVEVDQQVFDNQVGEIVQTMDAIEEWSADPSEPDNARREFHFQVGDEFKEGNRGPREMFYLNPSRDSDADARKGIQHSVARLPGELHDLVMAGRRIDRHLALKVIGDADVTTFKSKYGIGFRRAIFTHIAKVEIHSPVLQRRKAARASLEQNGWRRRLSIPERKEIELEARTARSRAAHLEQQAKLTEAVHDSLHLVERDMGMQVAEWEKAGVGSTVMFPMGMRFVQNPIYAAALAAFHRVSELERHVGIGGGALDRLGSINMLHASAVYERWCLIKIIDVLMADFGFAPQGDWVEHVIASACRAAGHGDKGFSVEFRRADPKMMARLEIEPVLDNGRRPDFRLRFEMGRSDGSRKSIFQDAENGASGLVMDAKFRTRWQHDELGEMLKLLVETKKYGQDGCRVFILQPALGAIQDSTSPLAWGRDCDYGHRHPTRHAHGSIQLAADLARGGGSVTNLRRLIAMELQDVFPEPEAETIRGPRGDVEVCTATSSFCISCGTTHDVEDVTPGRTGRANRKWYFGCGACGAGTMHTRCFGCGTAIHKNGLQMTYHLTVADQISNVVCQQCGRGF
ncbi:hypothetical protein AB3M93_08525 [Novosphingobium panipatense]|uniref:hypothetical protein n=1 Tax=Novosphingobium panipatense TaxID=428991 RepID=UPI0039A111D0